jgi:hypothetical protein
MLTASRVLGTETGSTAPVFLAFLAIHVLGGITAVACGAIAAITARAAPARPRGPRVHRAITVVFATAAILAAMRWRQDYHLLILGTVAFTAASIGYQHRRRHRPATPGTSPA